MSQRSVRVTAHKLTKFTECLISCGTTKTSSSMLNTKSFLPPTTGNPPGELICESSVIHRPCFHSKRNSIHDAFIELSKRSEDRPNKPVVKLIFDRGNPKQIYKNHQKVAEEEWGALGLPTRDQIPNIHFQAMVRVVCIIDDYDMLIVCRTITAQL